MTTDAIAGTPQVFKRKATQHEVIQFTGKNSKTVAEWLRDRGYMAKAGGSYVDITDAREFTQRLTRGMLMVELAEKHLHIYHTVDEFRSDYVIGKTHELV